MDEREYKHQWYLRNRDRVLEKNKRRYHTVTKKDPALLERKRKQAREAAKKYAASHREQIREYNRTYQKTWSKTNKGKVIQKRWRESAKGKASFWKYRKSAKGNITSRGTRIRWYYGLKRGTVTIGQWLWLLHYFKDSCAYCLRKFDRRLRPEMDHIEPLGKKAKHEATNIVPCCRSCNSSKARKPVTEFLKRKGWTRAWVSKLPLPVPEK